MNEPCDVRLKLDVTTWAHGNLVRVDNDVPVAGPEDSKLRSLAHRAPDSEAGLPST